MSSIIEHVKKQIQLKRYHIERASYLKNSTFHLGLIQEEDNKIIVNVTQNSVDKYSKNGFYQLQCYGIDTFHETAKMVVDKFKLDKPRYYIFDGIVFHTFVKLSSNQCYVIFRNCTFENGLSILSASDLILENNKYINSTDYYIYGQSFLCGNVKNLTIKNDNFVNSYESNIHSKNRFGIDIKAQKVYISHSNICAESEGIIDIKTKELYMMKSKLKATDIYLNSDTIHTNDTLLEADNGIMVDDRNCNFFCHIKSPVFIYNNVDYSSENKFTQIKIKKEIQLKEEQLKLETSRNELIQLLRNIRDNCKEENSKKIKNIQRQLEHQSVCKILKK